MAKVKKKSKTKSVKDERLEINAAKKPKLKKEREAVKKKKKSSSKELVVVTPSKKEKKKASKRLEQRLEKRKQQIVEYAQVAEILPADSEKEYFDEYTHIFKSLQTLTRIAETKYQDSQQSRDIYALMAMYSQMRECIADMRSIRDLNEMSESLIRAILDPFLRNIGQVLVEQYQKMEKMLKLHLKSKDVEPIVEELKAITSESAHKAQEHYGEAKQLVFKYFTENS